MQLTLLSVHCLPLGTQHHRGGRPEEPEEELREGHHEDPVQDGHQPAAVLPWCPGEGGRKKLPNERPRLRVARLLCCACDRQTQASVLRLAADWRSGFHLD